jgi:hypothetical protein
MALGVKGESYNTVDKEYRMSYNCSGVELEFIVYAGGDFKPIELIDSTSCDSRGSSRVRSRAIASSDEVVLGKIEATHLAVVDSATVVSTRRWCGKGLNQSFFPSTIMRDDAHGVASFNLFNILPSDLMTAQWVDDYDSLVVKDNCGMQKDLVQDCTSKNSPSTRNQTASESVIKEVYVGESAKEKKAQEGKEIRASRAEKLSVAHPAILSRARELRVA